MKECLKCRNCANTDMKHMRLEGGGKFLFCEACGAKTPLYEAYIVMQEDFSNKIESLLALAQHHLECDDYEHAAPKFREVLNYTMNDHRAWWGLFVCERYFAAYYGFKNKYGEPAKAKILHDLVTEYALKAIDNASDEVASVYRKAIADDVEFINRAINSTKMKKSWFQRMFYHRE